MNCHRGFRENEVRILACRSKVIHIFRVGFDYSGVTRYLKSCPELYRSARVDYSGVTRKFNGRKAVTP